MATTISEIQLSPELDSDVSNHSEESNVPTATTVSSAGSPRIDGVKEPILLKPGRRLDRDLAGFYSQNVAAKVWKVAEELLKREDALAEYPEFVPTDGEQPGKYKTRIAQFWTCGFFPGSLYALLERCMKYPKYLQTPTPDKASFQSQLLNLCRTWSEPLHNMAFRTNTHDLGFIIQPALRMDWELTGNHRSLQSVITAAHSLASRYDSRIGAIRSWDQSVSHAYNITDKEKNFLVIIDSMCNMDLLFYAGHHTNDQNLIDKATSHAKFALKHLVRKDFSTFHVVNIDPQTITIKSQHTHQGYRDDSTWSRGQAWAILGFTQTYIWTRDPVFLETATSLADHFLTRLDKCSHAHPYVPPWDFDAPSSTSTTTPSTTNSATNSSTIFRDTSAGMIAANGLVLLHQILRADSRYLDAALRIASETLEYSLAPDVARFEAGKDGKVGVVAVGGGNAGVVGVSGDNAEREAEAEFDAILMHSTANWNENALVRYGDHGLVYADYYFLELGNKLLRMGLV